MCEDGTVCSWLDVHCNEHPYPFAHRASRSEDKTTRVRLAPYPARNKRMAVGLLASSSDERKRGVGRINDKQRLLTDLDAVIGKKG